MALAIAGFFAFELIVLGSFMLTDKLADPKPLEPSLQPDE